MAASYIRDGTVYIKKASFSGGNTTSAESISSKADRITGASAAGELAYLLSQFLVYRIAASNNHHAERIQCFRCDWQARRCQIARARWRQFAAFTCGR